MFLVCFFLKSMSLNNCCDILGWSHNDQTKVQTHSSQYGTDLYFQEVLHALLSVYCSNKLLKLLPSNVKPVTLSIKKLCLEIGHTFLHTVFSFGNTSLLPSHPLRSSGTRSHFWLTNSISLIPNCFPKSSNEVIPTIYFSCNFTFFHWRVGHPSLS